MIGRSLPDLGARSLAAAGQAVLLDGEEMRFTLEETRALLEGTYGLRLSEAAVEKVHARSRGWVTALQLLRQTARLDPGAPEIPDEVFARTESEVFDYFSEEVLASEPRETRECLLGCAPPEVVDPEVCAEALPGVEVRGILAEVLRRGLFISRLDSRGGHLAFDPLFRDFLRRKLLAERGPEGARPLHLRYGEALARRGEPAGARHHLREAGEVRPVVDILARHGKALLQAGMLDAVREAAHFAASQGARAGAVEDLLGEACRLAGDHAAAVGHFERALAARRRGAPELKGTARAGALQGLAYSLLKTGDAARAASVGEEALAAAGEEAPALTARILNTLSIIRYRGNRLEEALAGWQQALARARQGGDEHLTLMIAHNLGLPHAAMGEFDRASECFQTLTSPENTRAGPEEGAACLNLARIATLRGDHERAASLLGDAREIARRWRLPGLEADVLEAEGTLMREAGVLEEARGRYQRARALFTELGLEDLLLGLAEEEAILEALAGDAAQALARAGRTVEARRASGEGEGLASALLALGEVCVRAGENARAAEALAESASIFESVRRAYQRCAALLWSAAAAYRLGRTEAAGAAASEALALASRRGYRALVERVGGVDAGFGSFLSSLAGAPGDLAAGRRPDAGGARGPFAATAADLTIRLLGPVEVYRDPQRKIPSHAWKIRRALKILAYLAAARDHRASKEKLVDAIWGEARTSVIEKNFHPTISFLRRALNHGHNVPKNFILYEGGAYRLHPVYRYEVDLETFEARVRAARAAARSDPAGALEAFDAAVALYRGPLIEEEYDEWTESPRARLESLYAAALGEAGELHVARGDPRTGLSYLTARVERDPLDEAASAAPMRALGAAGNRAGVEREFRRLSRALAEDLASDPLPETRRAYLEALESGAGRASMRSPPQYERKLIP